MKLKGFLFFYIYFLINIYYAQSCTNSVVPPTTINGVNITGAGTGTSTYSSAFTSCGYTTPSNSIWMGSGGAFSYTFNFSTPVNNVVIVLTATGGVTDELFTFNTNSSLTTISDNGSCFSSIAGNVISSGAGSGSAGGGGIFTISGNTSFTTLTITGPGGQSGSLFSLCSNSIVTCSTPNNNFIGNDTLICSSSFVPFTKTSPTYASYSWEDFSGNVLATTASYTFLDSGSYILKTTGVTPQCDGLDTLVVTFKSTPKSIFESDSVCIGTATTFTNNSAIIAPATILTTNWDFGDGITDNTINPTHLYSSGGTYNVTLSTTSDNNSNVTCSHDTIIEIVVYEDPIANFTVSNDCLYDIPIFTESSTISLGTITNWEWSFGDVLPFVIQSTDQIPTANYLVAGSYDIRLIVTSNKGCDDTLIKTTIRHPIPQLNFSASPACKNDSTIFTNSSTVNNISVLPIPPDIISSWVWSYGDGSPFSSQKVKNHKYIQDGYYSVTLIASTNNGCVNDATIFVQVYPLPEASFTATLVCENTNATSFFNTSSVSLGNVTNYHWNFDYNGATAITQFTEFNYPTAGTYNVELAIESNYGCKDTVWNNVTVYKKPTANFIADIKEGCFPFCTRFQDNSESNATSITDYFWFFGNGEVVTTASPEICFGNKSPTENAVYNASLIVTNDVGCKDTVQEVDFVTVWPQPNATFELDPSETTIYESDITFTNLSEGALVYSWTYGDGNESTVFEENHIYNDTGTYKINLVVFDVNNCTDSITKVLKIDPVLSIYVPNTFTPNGDGVNDFFFVEGLAIDYDKFEFSIYDRWGTLVYYANGNFPWDGIFKGEPAPEDVYVYRVVLRDLNGKYKEYEGHVNLLK